MGAGNKTALERQENTGRQLELICTVTTSACTLYDIKKERLYITKLNLLPKKCNQYVVYITTNLCILLVHIQVIFPSYINLTHFLFSFNFFFLLFYCAYIICQPWLVFPSHKYNYIPHMCTGSLNEKESEGSEI